MHIQPFMPYSSIVSFDVSVLRRLSGLDIEHRDLVSVRPVHQLNSQVFRTVVAPNRSWFTALLNDLIEGPYHSGGRQLEVDLNAQPFSVVVIDNVEGSKLATTGQGVAHEVHRTHLIDRHRHAK